MPRRLIEQTNMVRTQFIIIYRSSHLLCIIWVRSHYFKKLVLATVKSSCTISRAENFARSARVLQAVLRK